MRNVALFDIFIFLLDLTSLLLYIFGFVFNVWPFLLYMFRFYSIFYDLYSILKTKIKYKYLNISNINHFYTIQIQKYTTVMK